MILKSNYYKLNLSLIFILVLGLSFLVANRAEAATLSLTSSNNKVTVGSLITVNLFVNTQGKTINNAEASIQYSNDLVDVISVKGSLFSLWVESPSFSNANGLISFNGGIPDPGYNGGGGKILTIVAKAKKAGNASFLFSDAAVRENDGLGTDILNGQSPINIVIASIIESENKVNPTTDTNATNSNNITPPTTSNTANTNNSTTNQVAENKLSPVAISSPIYSNSESWYSAKDGVVSWSLPSQASAVQTLIDHNPYSTPTIKYSSPILSKNLSNLNEGTWYFHLRYLLNNNWSKISHFKIQIDSTPPQDLNILAEKDNNQCINGLKFSANDLVSGLDYYDVSIDDEAALHILATGPTNTIPWSQYKVGNHRIVAMAYDKAGNKSETFTEIKVDKLEAPVFDSWSNIINTGEKLNISGKSIYAHAPLKLTIESQSGVINSFDVISDESGNFSFASEVFSKAGNYKISIYALGCSEDINSLPTSTDITVKPLTDSQKLSTNSNESKTLRLWNILKVILFLILLFGWYKYIVLKVHSILLKKKAKRSSMFILLEKANKELIVLEKTKKKKSLTRGEEKSLDNLRKTISDINDIYTNKK